MTDLKDGGTRKTYGTGAQKEDDSKTEGKGAYHLLPTHPIRRVAEIYRKGAMKYTKWLPVDPCKSITGMVSLCTCQKEKHFATQIADMLLSECVSLVTKKILDNDKDQKKPDLIDLLSATQIEFISQEDSAQNAIKKEPGKKEKKEQNLHEWQTVIQNSLIIVGACVEIATRQIFDEETQILLNARERIEKTGGKKIKNILDNRENNIGNKPLPKTEKSYEIGVVNSPNMDLPLSNLLNSWITKIINALYVEKSPRKDNWILTIITQLENREDFCVQSATKDSVCLEIVSTLLKQQSPTCKIHHTYRLKDNQVEKFHQGARNWEKGIPLTRFLDSAKRHLDQFAEGMEDEDHLHQAIWNLFGLSHTIEQIKRGNLPTSLDDLPSYPIPGEKFREPGPGLDLPDEEKGLWPVKPMEEEKKARLETAGWKVSDTDTFIAGADCPTNANEVETTCANCIHYDCPLPEEMGYCDISNRTVYTYWTCSEVEERKEEKPEPTAPLMPSGPFTHCRTCSSFSINKQWCDTYKHYTLPHWNCGKWS